MRGAVQNGTKNHFSPVLELRLRAGQRGSSDSGVEQNPVRTVCCLWLRILLRTSSARQPFSFRNTAGVQTTLASDASGEPAVLRGGSGSGREEEDEGWGGQWSESI